MKRYRQPRNEYTKPNLLTVECTFGSRYYDPDTARFITQDSYLGESNTPPSLHRYMYAYSNPTVYIDLYGFDSLPQLTTPTKTGYVEKLSFYTHYAAASRAFQNPNYAYWERGVNLLLATASAPVTLVEEYGLRTLFNSPNTMYNSSVATGEYAARTVSHIESGNYEEAVVDSLHVIENTAGAMESGLTIAAPLSALKKPKNIRPKTNSPKTKITVEAPDGSANFKKLNKNEVGAVGEKEAVKYLEKRGHTDIKPIQNKSGHGIDLVSKNRKGVRQINEVKATTTDKPGRLSKPQSDPQNFTTSRLEKAKEGKGHWKKKNVAENTQNDAREILKEIQSGADVKFKKIDVYLEKDGTLKKIKETDWKKNE